MPSFAFAQAIIAEGSRKRETAKSPEGAKCRDVIKPVFFGSMPNVGVRIIKFHNTIFSDVKICLLAEVSKYTFSEVSKVSIRFKTLILLQLEQTYLYLLKTSKSCLIAGRKPHSLL